MSHALTSYIGYRLRCKQRWLSVGQYLQRYFTTQRLKCQTQILRLRCQRSLVLRVGVVISSVGMMLLRGL